MEGAYREDNMDKKTIIVPSVITTMGAAVIWHRQENGSSNQKNLSPDQSPRSGDMLLE